MKTIYYPASKRGGADYGWLQTRYSFSFADYYDANKIHFGALRVLNDDSIAPQMGFQTHSHSNMEIVTIMLKGSLKHKDSMGNNPELCAQDVQVMSAGSGISHSEFSASSFESAELLQIWVFPNQKDVVPRYDQLSLQNKIELNQLTCIVSPQSDQKKGALWIYQDAYFYLGTFEENKTFFYPLEKNGNGIYAFIIEGSFKVQDQLLQRRDALSIEGAGVSIESQSKNSRLLLIEVPMQNKL